MTRLTIPFAPQASSRPPPARLAAADALLEVHRERRRRADLVNGVARGVHRAIELHEHRVVRPVVAFGFQANPELVLLRWIRNKVKGEEVRWVCQRCRQLRGVRVRMPQGDLAGRRRVEARLPRAREPRLARVQHDLLRRNDRHRCRAPAFGAAIVAHHEREVVRARCAAANGEPATTSASRDRDSDRTSESASTPTRPG